MLIRITNRCNMMCSHCMLESVSPTGGHMTRETFRKALEFADSSGTMVLAISGGEPTLHPNVLEFIRTAYKYESGRFGHIVLCSNGTFLRNKKLTEMLKKFIRMYDRQFSVQITNDSRYYPKSILKVPKEFILETNVRNIRPCKRVVENKITPTLKQPGCFNLRSVSRVMGYRAAIPLLEMGKGAFCVPSVNIDGSVRAGEPDSCAQLGTVESGLKDIQESIESFSCNKCGLEDNLDLAHLNAIGSVRIKISR